MPNGVKWVGTWAAAPAPAEGFAGFNNHTIRQNPRVSIGGERLRVRISNAYGDRPLQIGAANVARRANGPAIVAGSDRKLTFGGEDGIALAAGAVAFSDPVELEVEPLADLAVSIYLPGEVSPAFQITGRYARQTNYVSRPATSPPRTVMRGRQPDRSSGSSSAGSTCWRLPKRAAWWRLATHYRRQHLNHRRLVRAARPAGRRLGAQATVGRSDEQRA